MCSTDIFLGLLAILFPPIAVWVKTGICSADSIINILLCMLGFLPGLIHAWYIIAKYPEPSYEYDGPADSEGGQVYVFVRENGQRPAQPHGGMNYGTASNASSSQAPAPAHAAQQHGVDEGGPSDGHAPPSYAQVVAGDHKVQSQE
ncbi:hypothetical protein B0T17DRAFT_482210 [Bombardia bombarda]|uniref:Stress response RCI peptide n=1 Tax=Bombardia bombarda TaxID=252184 RepID=A0AA39XQ38_9PEZI|nr:hypothetical protein B0T17DRAFT_482210 [Bombardia bombarda]